MAGGSDTQTQQSTVQNYDQRQVNSWNMTTTLDGGAVQGMVDTASNAVNNATQQVLAFINGSNQQTLSAYDHADHMLSGVVDAVNASGNRELSAYDRAATLLDHTITGANAANATALSTLQNAYADAKGTSDSQKSIILAVLAIAGVMAFAVVERK